MQATITQLMRGKGDSCSESNSKIYIVAKYNMKRFLVNEDQYLNNKSATVIT
jgi:hypothetical protein